MRMFFTGGSEHIRLDIDRSKKTAVIYSSKTEYQPKPIKFYELFPGDKRQQKIIERLTSKFGDTKFYDTVAKSVGMAGYTLVKVVKDEPSKDRE